MGRDKFEVFCFARGFRVARTRNYRITTDSRGVERFPNLIRTFELTGINQVFVSDITYYYMNGRFFYITLIMDLFNREVVGYSVSNSLRTEGTTLEALTMAAANRSKKALYGCIIHSDGGGQYYSHVFKALTAGLKMLNSMTEESVLENSHAERLNGTIKNDYLYRYHPTTLGKLKKELKRAVYMYNNGKSHNALRSGKNKKMTPVAYRIAHSIDFENNPSGLFPEVNRKSTTSSNY